MNAQLGGEPVSITTLLQVALAAMMAWGWFDLTDERVGLIMGVVAAAVGVYRAWVTRDSIMSVSLGLIGALVALGAGYGYNLSENTMALITAAAAVGIGFIQRQWTYPTASATFSNAPQPRYGAEPALPVGDNPPIT